VYKITTKLELAPKIKLLKIQAPEMAAKAQPGQFVIVMLNEKGERIPLTIADYDSKEGSITFVLNEVGKTTMQLGCLNEGDSIPNVLGPLGKPSEIRNFGNVLCAGAGVMNAPLFLQAKTLRKVGNKVTTAIGARTKDLLIFEKELRTASDEFYVATDDGSKGLKGLDFLKDLLRSKSFQRAVVMGPVVTMKAVSEMTKPFGVPTVVTLTPIMVDGMGMCGVCRVAVGGETKFACIDGPEFDGHKVDFEELVKRQRMFLPEERLSSLLWEKMGGGCRGGA
jgi:ferredoxin--NADP+ reductase